MRTLAKLLMIRAELIELRDDAEGYAVASKGARAGLEAIQKAIDALNGHPALVAYREAALDELARAGEGQY